MLKTKNVLLGFFKPKISIVEWANDIAATATDVTAEATGDPQVLADGCLEAAVRSGVSST